MLPVFLFLLIFPSIQGRAYKQLNYTEPTKVELNGISQPVLNETFFKSYNPDLGFLKISNSTIGEIDKNAFDNLAHLNVLDLSDNDISSDIDWNTFTRIRSLEKLILKQIHLKHVSLNLSNVQELILSNNQIENIDENDIVGESINYLDISRNNIKNLDSSFGPLKRLSTIDLSHNSIVEISPDVFKSNNNLIRIRAKDNYIKSLTGLNLPRLKYLSLSSNTISSLKREDFAQMKFLEELDLNKNLIENVEDPFKDLIELRFLDLSDNRISYIQPDLFRNNFYLTRLLIKRNLIEKLDRFAGDFHHLSVLNFAGNNIASIDSDFFLSMPNIEVLDLSHNLLKDVSGLFDPLKNLKIVYLQKNQIAVYGGEFKNNLNLQFLNFASNVLNLGLSHFENNKKLTHLDLSNNLITNFCDADFALENLMKINLYQNSITDLSCLSQNFSSLCEVDLRENSLKCGKDFDDLMISLANRGCSLYHHPKKDYFYSFFDIQMDIPRDQCELISLNQSLDLWNSIKNDLCPGSIPIPPQTTEYQLIFNRKNFSSKTNFAAEIFSMMKEKIMSDSESKSKEDIRKVMGEKIKEHVLNKMAQGPSLEPQSERISWEKIDKDADLVKSLEDQEESKSDNYSWYAWFTAPAVLIVLAIGLTVFNVVVFLYIRLKAWKTFNSCKEKNYTVLQNEVYKNTTEPSNSNQFSGSQWDSEINLKNKMFAFNRIHGLLFNLKLKKEKESESTKNILINSSHSLNI